MSKAALIFFFFLFFLRIIGEDEDEEEEGDEENDNKKKDQKKKTPGKWNQKGSMWEKKKGGRLPLTAYRLCWDYIMKLDIVS